MRNGGGTGSSHICISRICAAFVFVPNVSGLTCPFDDKVVGSAILIGIYFDTAFGHQAHGHLRLHSQNTNRSVAVTTGTICGAMTPATIRNLGFFQPNIDFLKFIKNPFFIGRKIIFAKEDGVESIFPAIKPIIFNGFIGRHRESAGGFLYIRKVLLFTTCQQ